MKKHLIILRGISGCGKSTVAEMLQGYGDMDSILNAKICCADDFFMKDGEYKFNANALGIAHKLCFEKCENAMIAGEARVIVANTSTTDKELKPYIDLAEKYGYMVFSLIVENRHGGSNVHNVPETSLTRMLERFSIKLR
jgi:predicted kinase